MTNKELFYNFQIIENENDNIFDKYCALQDLSESYKTTLFYEKFSNFSVIDAYNLYIKDTTSVGSLMRDFKNVDLPQLINIMTEKLDITKTMDSLNPETVDLLKLILEQK